MRPKSFFSLLLLLLVVALPQASCSRNAAQTEGGETERGEIVLETEDQRHSYGVGVQFGRALEHSRDRIDMEVFTRALEDAMSGADLAMSEEELALAMARFSQLALEDTQEALTVEGKAYLEEKAKEEGVVVLPSGLQYKIIQEGTGASPEPADTIEAHYRGTFVDGNEFDSSYDRDEPATFPVNRVISGWTEALQLMKVGGKWELYIPYDLAYGAAGRQGIPPFSTLVFEIELLGIVEVE